MSIQCQVFARMNPSIRLVDIAHLAMDGSFTNRHVLREAHDVTLCRPIVPERS